MSRQLYEEVLADARQLKQIAEDNAKRALLEAVTPQIRSLIEKNLMGDPTMGDEDDEEVEDEDSGELPPGEEILTDDALAEPVDDEVAVDVSAMHAAPLTPAAPVIAPTPAAVPPLSGQASAANFAAPVATGRAPAAPAPPGVMTKGAQPNQPPAIPAAPPTIMPPPVLGGMEPGVDTTQMPADDRMFELNLESLDSLVPVIAAYSPREQALIERSVRKVAEKVQLLSSAAPKIRATTEHREQILQTISRVENMYDYVQETVTDPAKKKLLEKKLEMIYGNLNKLRETKMAKKQIKEDAATGAAPAAPDATGGAGEVTLKLTGLPADLDLDSVGVDLIQGDESVGGDDLAGLDADVPGDDMGLDAAPEAGAEDDLAAEGYHMDENTVVEIDEGMLRREIARMKKMNEEFKTPSVDGNGVDSAVMDDFGGGKDDGDPWTDHDVTTADNLKESDCDDELDEADLPPMDGGTPPEMHEGELTELQLKRKEEEKGADAANSHSVKAEANKRLAAEKALQEKLSKRIGNIKVEAKKAQTEKKAKRFSECKTAYADAVKRMNESKARVSKLQKQLAESTKAIRSNTGAARSAETQLRTQLAEANLFNAKLIHTNKLLQNESLSDKQKAQIIERLDEAQSLREVKLVYESLVKTLGGSTAKTMNEGADRRVMGSASRPTRTAGSTLDEGATEATRWAILAGINR